MMAVSKYVIGGATWLFAGLSIIRVKGGAIGRKVWISFSCRSHLVYYMTVGVK